MVVPEHALIGVKEIAEYLCLSIDCVYNNYIPKMKEYGIIFKRLEGKIPHRRQILFTYPSLIQKFLMNEKKSERSKSKSLIKPA